MVKLRLEFSLRNCIVTGIGFLTALLLWIFVRYPLWAMIFFVPSFGIISFLKVDLDPRMSWVWTSVLVLPGALLTTFSIQYLILDAENFVKTSLMKWQLNYLCVLCLYLAILAISIRPRISCIIAHSFFMIFSFVDYFVYMFRQTEFSLADIRAAGTGLSVASKYSFQLTPQAVYVLFWSALYIALVLKCRITFTKKMPSRILALMLAVLVCIPVGTKTKGMNTETWELKGTYKNGYVLNFLLQIRDSFIREPKGYDLNAIHEMEKIYSAPAEETDRPKVKDPVIIVIMNESFADLTTIGKFNTNLPITPFIDSLKENIVKGYALSSVFAAKTPNSEWEYQTGNSMAFLPAGSVVYQQYINRQPYSIVTELKKQDYTCVAMHPYYDSGWSRNSVYPRIGYDEMHFIEDFDQEKILREYITDKEMYERVIDRYERRKEGEKLFILGITMQNHGGYTQKYDNFTEKYYKTGGSYTDANQYLSLIRESDDAVKELITYFSSVDQPVEIVFFGDHQPGLNSSFYRMLNKKGLSGLTLEQLENLYKVPFFIWTNYESGAKEIPITSLNYLSTMTMERAGIVLPPYNRFLAEMMKKIPAINSRGYYSQDYKIYRHIEDAEGEEKKWIQQYEMLQYNSMFDKKNRSEVFFPYPAAE